ncbi:MAG: hypothetical protein HYU97_00980 [Deltaproteobacteria bacterium]|nr:hypothetical protein [Deltaproteobacteria bacterium]
MKTCFLATLSLFILAANLQAAIPPPAGCDFDESQWEIIVYVSEVKPLSKKEKFPCGKRQRFEAMLDIRKIIKGKPHALLQQPWKQTFVDYDYTERGCTGPTDHTFSKDSYYRLFLHKQENGEAPRYCNHYMTKSVSPEELKQLGITN